MIYKKYTKKKSKYNKIKKRKPTFDQNYERISRVFDIISTFNSESRVLCRNITILDFYQYIYGSFPKKFDNSKSNYQNEKNKQNNNYNDDEEKEEEEDKQEQQEQQQQSATNNNNNTEKTNNKINNTEENDTTKCTKEE